MPSQTETSSTNTGQASAPPDDIRQIGGRSGLSKVDISAEVLERNLQAEIDGRRTERFFWIFATSGLVYVIACALLDGGFASFGLLFLVVGFLIGAADWLGVEEVVLFLKRSFSRIEGMWKG